MIDELREGVETFVAIFQEDYLRIFYLLLVSAVILGVFLAASVIPNYFGIGPKNPDFAYCASPGDAYVLQQGFVLAPLFTYITNPPLGQAQMGCPVVTSNYGLIALYFVEMTVVVTILGFIAVIFAHSMGIL